MTCCTVLSKIYVQEKDGEVTFYTPDVYTNFNEGDKEKNDPLSRKTGNSLRLGNAKYTVGDYYIVNILQ